MIPTQLYETFLFREFVPEGLRVPVMLNDSRLLISVVSAATPRGSWKLELDSGICHPLVFEERIKKSTVAHNRLTKLNRVMQVSTNLAEHTGTTVVLNDISIADAKLPRTEVVILKTIFRNPPTRRMDFWRQ